MVQRTLGMGKEGTDSSSVSEDNPVPGCGEFFCTRADPSLRKTEQCQNLTCSGGMIIANPAVGVVRWRLSDLGLEAYPKAKAARLCWGRSSKGGTVL